MRSQTLVAIILASSVLLASGCQTPGPAKRFSGPFTAENNPTTQAGRGEPSLDELFRAAAWVSIDGYGGRYTVENDHPQVQWIIDDPVSSTPTFQVDVYEPLLGSPTHFKCALRTIEADDGSNVTYGIRTDSALEVGRTYSLVAPGEGFVVQDPTRETYDEIPPLSPGRYLLAAGIKNTDTGKEAVAITYFTVGQDN